MIEKVVKSHYNSNSFFYIKEKNCFIVDSNLHTLPYLEKNNLNPVYIFLTHEHFDHIEGISKIKEKYPAVKIISSKITSTLIQDNRDNMSFYLDGIGIKEYGVDIFIEDCSSFKFYDKKIQTYPSPGHTEGGIIIHIDNILFTGDTILNTKTPTSFPTSSKEKLKETIEFIDKNFDENTIFYQGHNDEFLKKDWDKKLTLGIAKKHI